jgi:hypothetical protein
MAFEDIGSWGGFSGSAPGGGLLSVGSGYGGAPDNIFAASPSNWWNNQADSTWNQLLGGVTSKQAAGLAGQLGQGLTSAAGGTSQDPRWLRTAAGSPPQSLGSQNSLLNTLLQMQLQREQLEQYPLGQSYRSSLLG